MTTGNKAKEALQFLKQCRRPDNWIVSPYQLGDAGEDDLNELIREIEEQRNRINKLEKECERLRKKAAADGSHCCCTFEEDGETPINRCAYHSEQENRIKRMEAELKKLRGNRKKFRPYVGSPCCVDSEDD